MDPVLRVGPEADVPAPVEAVDGLEQRRVALLDEVLRVRPDLAPFRECVRELLRQDPLVQSPDGRYFVLA